MLLLLSFNCSLFTYSQDTTKKVDDSSIQQQLENIAENTNDEEADYTNLVEVLVYSSQNPINLNKTNREELQALELLNDIQINNLLTHIEKNGKLITIYELQGISGFDLQTIQKILPYVKVADNFTSAHFGAKEMFKNGQHVVLFRYGRTIEDQTGFSATDSASLAKSINSRYIGSPDKIYARYRFTYGTNISWGITAEKDQGELFFKNKQKFNYDWYENSLKGNQQTGFDFYSAHFYLKNVKFIKALAIGDYQATFGQGLTLWSGQAFGKSSDIMSTKRSAGGLRAYTSVDENRFMRGGATTLGFKKFEATAFYSRKRVDANVSDTTDTGEAAEISALQETGYHSTSSEIADKDAIRQTMLGGNIAYKGGKFNVGITALSYQLDANYDRALSYYNQFEFASSKNFNAGIDYNFIVRNFNFFGEAAISKNGGKAFVNGTLISLDPRLSLTLLHRYYERNFQNLMSNGFGESTRPANEKGLYIGMVAKPTNKTTVTAYYDRFEFPWLRYQVNAPSYGNDYMAQFNYTPSKKVDMYVRLRTRDKQKNATGVDLINYLVPVKQSNYRFNISYSITPSIKLKNRVELIDYKLDNNKTQKGYLVYQDVVYSKLGKPLSVTLRYAIFQTDSYDARIYAYENDVPGSYSIPAYYDRGSRFYILLDYNLTRRIELWLRYSQTFYDNKDVISEGSLTEIQGNTKSEVRAQVRFKF
ncbi:MAG: helix-hairpin-helix domain-containing protein [Bacteroidetes bacterium]|nr:helix-hairpin-helix domain-containing protein [Bacteroidota bacterium]